MHRLDRTTAVEPACLANYANPHQTWDDLLPEDKAQIRTSLEQMQGTRCAYCEGEVYADGHIEHFRRKNPNHFPELTFVWSNLFLSCGSAEHCGHYKDRRGAPPYEPDDLIKPDVDDPDDYLYFHSSGEVRPRSEPGAPDPRRARETIRVFHLDYGPLVAARRRALTQYQRRQPDILEFLEGLNEPERAGFIAEEVAATRDEPHATVIRHFFEKAL